MKSYVLTGKERDYLLDLIRMQTQNFFAVEDSEIGTLVERLSPKRVKKEGWVNVYADGVLGFKVYQTEEEANKQRDEKSRLFCACIRIEWEEEV